MNFVSLSLFYLFRTPAARIHSAKIMQFVSPVSHSRDIDACALLDSREKIVKKVRFKRCQKKQNIALNMLSFKDVWSSRVSYSRAGL